MLVPDGDRLCWFQMEIGCVLVPDGDRLCWFQMPRHSVTVEGIAS